MGDYSTSWGKALLRRLGAPVTDQNLLYLAAWAQAEGGHARYNPFNTTQQAAGSTAYNDNNGHPVRNYTSPKQGLDATYQTLTNGRYQDIVSALRNGSDAMAAAKALKASPWGTGGLVEQVLGGGGPRKPPTGTAVSAGTSAAPINAGAGGTGGGTVAEDAGFHIKGTPWNIPTPGSVTAAAEGKIEAGIVNAFMAILTPMAYVMMIGVGVWLLVAALLLLARMTGPGKAAIDAGMLATPVGEEAAAAKVVKGAAASKAAAPKPAPAPAEPGSKRRAAGTPAPPPADKPKKEPPPPPSDPNHPLHLMWMRGQARQNGEAI